ncbi:MAG: hypothetical protein US60_C0018G0003 [Microgenomates group bacterium GW2011_GWC1_37_8]|nr:MAG: hypothetical protein US60_C0018G0003 [Microgenomates group bacterium GW2011_GWC1_37_8]
MGEEVSNLKGDLVRLTSTGTDEPSKLKGTLPHSENSKPSGITLDDTLITNIRQRDGGDLYSVSDPYESELGSSPKKVILVKLTEIHPPEGRPPTIITRKLDDLLEILRGKDNPSWSIASTVDVE